MKKIIFTLALIGLIGCGHSSDSDDSKKAKIPTHSEFIIGAAEPLNTDDSTRHFAHLLNEEDVCSKDFIPKVLKNNDGRIDLGINSNGYRSFADFELYLFQNGTFISRYIETEEPSQSFYDVNGSLVPMSYRRKEIQGYWKMTEQNIVLPKLGMVNILGKSGMSMHLTFSNNLISNSLVGRTVTLRALEDATSKKKILCPEVYALGPFQAYREYQNSSINGLEAKNLVIDSENLDKSWSFKVYLDENNSFDIEYFVMPKENHTVWGWEEGRWTRDGNTLILENLATITITDSVVLINFKRPLNVETYLPEEFREEFDQAGKEYVLNFTRGYL